MSPSYTVRNLVSVWYARVYYKIEIKALKNVLLCYLNDILGYRIQSHLILIESNIKRDVSCV